MLSPGRLSFLAPLKTIDSDKQLSVRQADLKPGVLNAG